MDALATFKLGNGAKVSFWLDSWDGLDSLISSYPRLFKIALRPKGSVAEHWDEYSVLGPMFFVDY